MDIKEIKDPSFLKEQNIKELRETAESIREFLIESISKTGGHLSSNLGIIELTMALCKVFDFPKDKILFDVGHQSYVYKVLTGRAKDFDTLRQYKGLSGFQKRAESEYDCFEAGHSSTSLSAAEGMAIARDLNNENYEVIPVIGDGALLSGMSFEALNNIGSRKNKVIIIFNDNNMSISANVGGVSKNFNRLRTNEHYLSFKAILNDLFDKGTYRKNIGEILLKIKNTIKKQFVNTSYFGDFNLDYLGPVDGHDFKQLIAALETAKSKKESCVVHVITKKGNGYKYAEEDKTGKWHGVSPFDVETGKPLKTNKENELSYSAIVADTVRNEMLENENIVTITPAMISGSCLNDVFKSYPDRCFDVGIAEEHAVTMASGLALANKKPFVAIYSSFLQRAYDQLNHDICRMNLPLVIGVDRAGIVGADGSTHHGVFDVALLNNLPNMTICMGKDGYETANLLHSAFNEYQGAVAIRYPRGNTEYLKKDYELIPYGSWTIQRIDLNDKAIVITSGPLVDEVLNNIDDVTVVNARFIKPIDKAMVDQLVSLNKPIIVFTNEMKNEGLATNIENYLFEKGHVVKLINMGIDEQYVNHGDNQSLLKEINLSIEDLKKKVEELDA